MHAIKKQLYVTDRRLDRMRTSIENDAQMQTLKSTILEGWPEERSNCDPNIVEYWNHRDELSVDDGLIFRGQTLIVPRRLRAEILLQVHKGHLGITKTLERAKDSLFWPGMSPVNQVQFGKILKPAMVIKKLNDRSFEIHMLDRAVYRRNRKHLIKTRMNVTDISHFGINILDENKYYNQTSKSNTCKNQTDSMPYKTRFGRIVKENRHYTADKYSK